MSALVLLAAKRRLRGFLWPHRLRALDDWYTIPICYQRLADATLEMEPGKVIEVDYKLAIEKIAKVSPRSADEIWVSKDGQPVRVGDMDPAHLAHTLALILRTCREKGGFWKRNADGALRWYKDETAYNWSADT